MVKAENVVVDSDGEGEPITLDWFIHSFNKQIDGLLRMVNEHHGDMYNLHARMNIQEAKIKHLIGNKNGENKEG